jgi:hypothetical protein
MCIGKNILQVHAKSRRISFPAYYIDTPSLFYMSERQSNTENQSTPSFAMLKQNYSLAITKKQAMMFYPRENFTIPK